MHTNTVIDTGVLRSP